MQRFGLRVELEPALVDEYIALHQPAWPEVSARFQAVGFQSLSLFIHESTAFLYLEYAGDRSLTEALADYAADPQIQAWEALMRRFKRPMPGASSDNGFALMTEVFRIP